MQDNVYCISFGAQKKLIDKYCFGSCGKIYIGEINIMGGMFLPCGEKTCQHTEKELDLKTELTTGENVIIRKLKGG